MNDSPLPALPLPQFTFLCGSLGQGQVELMTELVSRDDNLIRMDFTYPIHNMLSELFPDTCPAMLDPLANLSHGVLGHPTREALNHDFPSLGNVDINQFIITMTTGLRLAFGPNSLGMLAYRYIVQHDILDNFKRVIFTDALDERDISLFITHYNAENVLCLHLGDMDRQYGTAGLACSHIWLSEPSLSRRISTLEKELSNGRPVSGNHN